MLVCILGPVSLHGPEGDVAAVPGSRQAALLAALAAHAGQAVGIDRLVEALWGDQPPSNPTAALHSTVFKLRAALAQVTDREVLVTRERGYALAVRPGDLDADVFAALVEEAVDQDPVRAAETLGAALRLWRGPAFGGYAEGQLVYLEALRLEELRRVAVERYGAALLAADLPTETILLLQPFVADQPLREAARATLMRALHAVGRTSEALAHYQGYREHLAEELGLEPSRALSDLQVSLLQPPEVTPSTPPVATAAALYPHSSPGLQGMAVRYLRTAAGNVIAYGTVGSGPSVVVLMGWISSLDIIASGRDPRSSVLDRLTDALSLTLYDRAGTGLSSGPVEDCGLEASVTELAEVVRAVGPPVSLLAMSSCGPVALALAHRRPQWVSSLILLGTFANGPETFADHRMTDMVVEIVRGHWGIGSRMLADLYRPNLSDEAVLHLARVFRDSAPAEVSAAYLEGTYPQDVSKLLPEISAPALVLHYRSDRLIPFRGGQQLAAGLPNATFLPLDGQVHLPDAADLDVIQAAVVSHVRRYQR